MICLFLFITILIIIIVLLLYLELDIETEITGPTEEITQKADEQLIKVFENAMSKAKEARPAGDIKLNTDSDKAFYFCLGIFISFQYFLTK